MNTEREEEQPLKHQEVHASEPAAEHVVHANDNASQKGSRINVALEDNLDNLSRDIERQKEVEEQKFIDKEKVDYNAMMEEQAQRVTEVQKLADQELNKLQHMMGLSGTRIQMAQQNSLLVLACQLIISTFLALLISQINPLQFIWELIPLLDFLAILLFFGSLAVVQFARGFLQPPMNFILFLTHTCSKIILLIFVSVWFEDYRMELFFVDVILLVGYMLFIVYSATQTQSEADMTIKGNFKNLVLYSLLISLFLVLFVRASIWVWIMLTIWSLLYAFFLLLSMQRFPEHKYLLEGKNEFYLGAAQLDSDLFFNCSFIRYMLVGLKKETQAEIEDLEKK